VYVIALPFFGIVSEIVPVFSRKPVFGYQTLVYATIAIAALSVTVWAHHMFTTGGVMLDFFSLMTMLIAVPTGVKFVNWIGTMWRGKLSFETPMLWSLGFMTTFVFGGVTGVILAAPALDFIVHDTYFVVAHFHYTVFGTVVFSMYAGIHFWFPKWTGRTLNETLGKITFWLTFIGFHTTFLIQHWLGAQGMPRRYADYMVEDGYQFYNQVSTVGAFILASSTIFFFINVYVTMRGKMNATEDDPWGYGNSLEWATSSPVPGHNFVSLPRIRSERPAFDLHHPEVTALEHTAPDEALLVAAGRGRTSDDTKENQA
jgi:cytochrome c oxidase subunit 1